MRSYTIYQKGQSVRAVKNGLSWVGFFFQKYWALFTRQWVLGIGFFVFAFIFNVILLLSLQHYYGPGTYHLFHFRAAHWAADEAYTGSEMIFMLLLASVFLVKGNHWLTQSLLKQGYEKKASIIAKTHMQAIATYRKNQ